VVITSGAAGAPGSVLVTTRSGSAGAPTLSEPEGATRFVRMDERLGFVVSDTSLAVAFSGDWDLRFAMVMFLPKTTATLVYADRVSRKHSIVS
jgi:hypothetical protein